MPIFLLNAYTVPSGFVSACLLAGSPTSNCPSLVKATYDGNAFPYMVLPSALGITLTFPFIYTAAAELLVPKSIPIIFSLIFIHLLFRNQYLRMSQYYIAKHIPLLVFLNNNIIFISFHDSNGFMEHGIKFFTYCLYFSQT